MGRKGSKSCKAIVESTGLKRYVGRKYHTDALVNYGLCGQKLQNFYSRFPSARRIPTINKAVGTSKLNALNRVKRHDILVPDSRLELRRTDKLGDWIEKRFSSQGGYGICKARGRRKLARKYYQRFVKDRKYELRVHAFKWIDSKKWKVQKRYGKEGEIAWNFSHGGHFTTVYDNTAPVFRKAIQISDEVLDILGMGFGAVDFIVDKDNNIYFIEINSCPGFQELSKGIYVEAFEKLNSMSLKEVLKYAK
jgi:glutathione synthase/RimK-type ligase-like ATP-grasp enzyme